MLEIARIAILGAGTMGRGIAQVAATAGFTVALRDLREDLAVAGAAAIEERLRREAAAARVDGAEVPAILERIRATGDLATAAASADLVIEAVPEDPILKRSLFAAVDKVAPPRAILASNTSSLSSGELASATSRPDRVIGMHFFNPVDRMALLELVITGRTSPDTLGAARAVGTRLGKTAIVVQDSPGFATSRLGVALGMEAIRMLEAGVASAADIDTAMELGYRHPMGPLRLTDLVGLDVRLAIADHLHHTLGSEVFRPPALLRRMVEEGRLGKKSGQGFYTWD